MKKIVIGFCFALLCFNVSVSAMKMDALSEKSALEKQYSEEMKINEQQIVPDSVGELDKDGKFEGYRYYPNGKVKYHIYGNPVDFIPNTIWQKNVYVEHFDEFGRLKSKTFIDENGVYTYNDSKKYYPKSKKVKASVSFKTSSLNKMRESKYRFYHRKSGKKRALEIITYTKKGRQHRSYVFLYNNKEQLKSNKNGKAYKMIASYKNKTRRSNGKKIKYQVYSKPKTAKYNKKGKLGYYKKSTVKGYKNFIKRLRNNQV